MTAFVNCVKQNMTLATIENAAENEQLSKVVKNSKDELVFFIGGTRTTDNEELMWVSNGKKIGPYTNWLPKGPTGFPNYCMVLNPEQSKWEVTDCWKGHPYICEYYEGNNGAANAPNRPPVTTKPQNNTKPAIVTKKPVENKNKTTAPKEIVQKKPDENKDKTAAAKETNPVENKNKTMPAKEIMEVVKKN